MTIAIKAAEYALSLVEVGIDDALRPSSDEHSAMDDARRIAALVNEAAKEGVSIKLLLSYVVTIAGTFATSAAVAQDRDPYELAAEIRAGMAVWEAARGLDED